MPGALTTLNTERQSPWGKTATGGFPAQNVASCSKEWLLSSSSLFFAAVSLKKKRKDRKGRLLGNGRLDSSLQRRWLQGRVTLEGHQKGWCAQSCQPALLQKATCSRLGPNGTDVGPSQLPLEIRLQMGRTVNCFKISESELLPKVG